MTAWLLTWLWQGLALAIGVANRSSVTRPGCSVMRQSACQCLGLITASTTSPSVQANVVVRGKSGLPRFFTMLSRE